MKNIRNLKERIQKLKIEKQEMEDELSRYYEERYGHSEEEEEAYENHLQKQEYDEMANLSLNQQMEKDISMVDGKIQKLENQLFQQELVIKVSKGQNRFRSGIAISDLKTSNDTLCRKEYAKIIANFIADKKSEKINVGVFGKWGQGKSSFIELIKDNLVDIKKFNNRKDIHIVYFNASEYDNREKIWTQLLRILFDKYEQEHRILSKFKYNFRLFQKDFKNNLFKYILNGIMFIIFLVLMHRKYINFDDIKNFKLLEIKNFKLSDISIIIPCIILIKDSIIPIIKSVFLASNKISSNLLNKIKFPKFDFKLGYKELVKDTYEVLISSWLQENEKIIVFVDELDRLSQKHIMEFFESMQLFIDNKELSFIMAIDYKTVCCAITEGNLFQLDNIHNTTKEKIKFGMNYIDKYINLPFHLNDEISHKLYIEKILCNVLESEDEKNQNQLKENDNFDVESNCTDRDEETTFTISNSEKETIFKVFDRFEVFNPRETKKILNLILLGKNIHYQINLLRFKEKKYDEITSFEEYIRWFCFSYKNSVISSYILAAIEKGMYEKSDIRLVHLINTDLKEHKDHVDFKIIETLKIGKIKYLNQISRLFVLDINKIE